MAEPFLETERLILRELTLDDVEPLSEVLGDPWTMRYYHHPFSREEVVDWVERGQASYRDYGFGLWALNLKEAGEFVGETGLTVQHVDGEPMVEVGWHVNKRFQRRGLATEAGRASLDYGFGPLGLDLDHLADPPRERAVVAGGREARDARLEGDHPHALPPPGLSPRPRRVDGVVTDDTSSGWRGTPTAFRARPTVAGSVEKGREP